MLPCTSTEMDGVLMTASTLMVEARTCGGGVSWDFLFAVGSVSQDMDKNDGKVV